MNSAEAANHDLEVRLPRANVDRRAAKTQLADLTKETDRLAARVKTLERDLGTVRKAAGAPEKPPAQTGEGAECADGPTVERAGGPRPAGVRYLLVVAQAWHAQAQAAAGQMSAVLTGLRMAMLASGHSVEVDTVAPDMAKVPADHEDVGRPYPPPPPPPPHGSGDRRLFRRGGAAELPWLRWPELCFRRGEGLAHPLTSGSPVPSNLHGC